MIPDRKMQGPLHPDARFAFEHRLEGSFDGVRAALALIMDRLRMLDLSEDARGIVELVLAETLNNIAEHAFADLPQPGFISVLCADREAGLYLRITDFGTAMPDLALPVRTPPKTRDDLKTAAVNSLPEGSFGWALIHELTCDVAYQRCGPMNALSLIIPVRPPEHLRTGAQA